MHHTLIYMEGGCKPTMDCDKKKSHSNPHIHTPGCKSEQETCSSESHTATIC